MTSKSQKIKCLFGFHKYTISNKQYSSILLCRYCKRFGYYRSSRGYEAWYEFNEKGKLIYYRSSFGYEAWYEYNEKGHIIRDFVNG